MGENVGGKKKDTKPLAGGKKPGFTKIPPVKRPSGSWKSLKKRMNEVKGEGKVNFHKNLRLRRERTLELCFPAEK